MAGGETLFTFDVFDTALVRRVALPADVFRLVARRLVERGAHVDAPAMFEEEFVSARVAAERIARERAHPREDCTLAAIWGELAALLPGIVDANDAAIEVEEDAAVLLANPALSDHIRELSARGERVLFISDIYYPREAVFRFLASAGLATDISQVYVSADAGLLKSSGALFRHVAAAEGVATRCLLHVGDNPVADHRAARAQGVRTAPHLATRLNGVERALLGAQPHALAVSRLVGEMRLARLRASPAGTASLVPTLLGPLFVIVAAWALRQAAAAGAARAVFVARDGYGPWCAAREIAGAFPGVAPDYVRLSRHALVAAMPELGDFGTFWVEKSWSKRTLGEIAGLRGFDWDELRADVAQRLPHLGRDSLLGSADEMRTFVAILDAPRGDGGSAAGRAAVREATLRYLGEAGLLDAAPFVTVDVGWFLNLQAALTGLLRSQGATGFVGGLYLGLCVGRAPPHIAGPARALFYEQPHSPDQPGGFHIFDRIILLEHLLGLAPHGTAIAYREGDGGVAVVEGPITPERRGMAERVGAEVSAFAATLRDVAADLGDEALAARVTGALLAQAFADPGALDLGQLRSFEVQRDSERHEPMHIVQPWRWSAVAAQLVPYRVRMRLGITHGPTLWPEASRAGTPRARRIALHSIRGARRVAAKLIGRGAR